MLGFRHAAINRRDLKSSLIQTMLLELTFKIQIKALLNLSYQNSPCYILFLSRKITSPLVNMPISEALGQGGGIVWGLCFVVRIPGD